MCCEYLKNREFLIALLLVAVALIALFCVLSRWRGLKMLQMSEHMDQVNNAVVGKPRSHSIDVKQMEEPVTPQYFDAGSGNIVAGDGSADQQFLTPWYKAYTGNLKNYYLLDDGEDGAAGLQFSQCSKSCCPDQYPLPFKMPVDKSVCDSKDEFSLSPYTCNNAWQDSGCVCMTKKQANFLGNRGGNA